MQVELRQLGHAGLAMMALSAVDIALWDLKAKLLGVCLADALPRFHDSVADLRLGRVLATSTRDRAPRAGPRVGADRVPQHEDQGRHREAG